MATAAAKTSIADRLSSTLFVAALAHGVVILGVTFASTPVPEVTTLPSLNVTLLVDSVSVEQQAPQDLLAARDQLGGGRPDDSARPTTMLSADQPISQLGNPFGADLVDGTPQDAAPSADQLTAHNTSDRRVQSLLDTTETPAAQQLTAATLIENRAPETLAAEIDDVARSQESEDDSDLANPSASESVLAEYLVQWRQRVERVGTANFPARFLKGGSDLGRPVLEVAIGARGQLEEIVVVRSSGDSTLDQAALKILRMAAPFDELPPAILAEFDVLRFAYEWDFAAGVQPAAPAGASPTAARIDRSPAEGLTSAN